MPETDNEVGPTEGSDHCTNRPPSGPNGQPTSAGGKYGRYKDAADIYEDGKHRRYTLLFSVNGAVAAITKLSPRSDMGAVGYWLLAAGMIAFTILMGYDIWIFGRNLRNEVGENISGKEHEGMFSRHGRFVLYMCCGLIVLGWFLMALWKQLETP